MPDKDKDIEAQLAKLQAELAESLDGDLAKLGEGINDDSAALQRERDLDRETARFTANALDRASTSLATVGVFTPLVGLLYHSSLVALMQNWELALAVFGCLGLAFVLHWIARGVLRTGFRR